MLVSPRFNQQQSLVQKAHVCARLSTESLLYFILLFLISFDIKTPAVCRPPGLQGFFFPSSKSQSISQLPASSLLGMAEGDCGRV